MSAREFSRKEDKQLLLKDIIGILIDYYKQIRSFPSAMRQE